ncbi:MAG: N-acetyltransferase [Candidatus Gastranaerophilales bacterium]|nr:N-acetyltransferase [Candidatus Gastranaerophilales bacterium]
MFFKKVSRNEKIKYMGFLLLADTEIEAIEKYIFNSDMYIFGVNNDLFGECVLFEKNNNEIEIKNIAIAPPFQGKGFGKKLLETIERHFKNQYDYITLGTNERKIGFYSACGFSFVSKIKDYFIKNYKIQKYHKGKLCRDLLILRKKINKISLVTI